MSVLALHLDLLVVFLDDFDLVLAEELHKTNDVLLADLEYLLGHELWVLWVRIDLGLFIVLDFQVYLWGSILGLFVPDDSEFVTVRQKYQFRWGTREVELFSERPQRAFVTRLE